MTAAEVAKSVRDIVDAYRPTLTTQEFVGQRIPLDQELAEVELLRKSLVLPSRRSVSNTRKRDVWLVAQHGGDIVFFDESANEFGLGRLEADGRIHDIEVPGDLVGCFMAR